MCSGHFYVGAPCTEVGVPASVVFARFDIEVYSGYLTYLKVDFVGVVAEACESYFTGKLAVGIFEDVFFLFPLVPGFRDARCFRQCIDDGSFYFYYGVISCLFLFIKAKVRFFYCRCKKYFSRTEDRKTDGLPEKKKAP